MRALAPIAALLLSACTTATGGLPYMGHAAADAVTTTPSIGRITAVDQRGEAPQHIGAIRGGFGNPLKVIETADPVQEEVDRAFQDALRRRGLLATPGGGTYNLTVTIIKLDCSQYVRREAHADFQIALTDRGGRGIYQDRVQVTVVEGSKLAMDVGIFGSPDDLRAVAIQAMPNFNTKIYIYVSFQSLRYRTTFLSTTFPRLVWESILQRILRCGSRLGNFIQSKSGFKPNRCYHRRP